MKVNKKVIAELNKCYSIAPLTFHGQDCFLVAAEKHDPCYLFSSSGEKLSTVWEEPGGVMTMLQVPGSDGQFLATHKFYSPNDSLEAKLVLATPLPDGSWDVRTICDAPFVHRFGILSRNGVNYLIVCCLKSGHEYKDDWRFPGATYAAVLPSDLSCFDEKHQLPLKLLKDDMCHNHGYSKYVENDIESGIVGCDSGVYKFTPPASPDGQWDIVRLISDPSSDAVLLDFDGDGEPEIGSISPFHGDTLHFYHKNSDGEYELQYTYPQPCPMLHATWTCDILGKPSWVVGYRQGDRCSMVITWEDGAYRFTEIDRETGAANALMLNSGALVMTNREINEIAMYNFTEE